MANEPNQPPATGGFSIRRRTAATAPVRFLGTALGATVAWDGETRTVDMAG